MQRQPVSYRSEERDQKGKSDDARNEKEAEADLPDGVVPPGSAAGADPSTVPA